jgi:antiviral helicase SLH1
MKAMVKPAFDLMLANNGPSICFVSHNNQCYNTLADLLTHSATSTHRFSSLDEETLSHYTVRVSDPKIAEGLLHGFGVVTSTMHQTDQAICKHLFQSGAIKTLILPRTAIYQPYARASLVIAMGTQYVFFASDSVERRIEDYALEDILRMQACASSSDNNSTAQFAIFTQSDAASLLSRLLSDGMPLESSLYRSDEFTYKLLDLLGSAEDNAHQRALDLLAKTYMSRRLASNPAYYGFPGEKRQQQRLSRVVDVMLEQARQSCLVRMGDKGVKVTAFGTLVRNRRISRSQLQELFSYTEAHAIKLLKARRGNAQAQPAGLEAFTQRLPKSLQRKLDLADPSSTLLVCFLNKKLPPADSELETLQADLVCSLLEHSIKS